MMSNPLWCLLLIAALAVLSVAVFRFARGVFLLVLCHNLVWGGALALIATNQIRYRPAATDAWLTLLAGIVAFNLGAGAIALVLARRRERAPRGTSAGWLPTATTFAVTRPIFYAALAAYALGFGAYLVNIQLRFGIVTLLRHPAVIRGASGESYLESVPLPARLLLYLAPLLFVFVVFRPAIDRPFPVPVRVVLAVVLGGTMLALLQRTNILVAMLLWVAALLSQRWSPATRTTQAGDKRGLRERLASIPAVWRVVGGIAALGIVSLAVFQGLGGALDKTGQESLRSGAVAPALAHSGLTAPFQYYTAGTMAFLQLAGSHNYEAPPQRVRGVYVVGDWNPQTWGGSTFSSILKLIPGAPHVDTISPFINTGVPTNVFTWLEPFYRDFRLTGVIVATLLMGAGFGWLFLRRFRSQTVFWISCVCMTTVFLAPFVARINSTLVISLVLYAAVLTLLTRWVRRRADQRTGSAASRQSGPVTEVAP